jgi:hypothetical protein
MDAAFDFSCGKEIVMAEEPVDVVVIAFERSSLVKISVGRHPI